MPIFGSSSRSRTTTNTEENITNTTDNRVVQGDGDIGGNINVNFSGTEATLNNNAGSRNPNASTNNVPTSGNSVSITTSDFGALDTAEEIAEQALGNARYALDSATASANSATQRVSQNALEVLDAAQNFVQSDSVELAKIAAVTVALIALAYFVWGDKK